MYDALLSKREEPLLVETSELESRWFESTGALRPGNSALTCSQDLQTCCQHSPLRGKQNIWAGYLFFLSCSYLSKWPFVLVPLWWKQVLVQGIFLYLFVFHRNVGLLTRKSRVQKFSGLEEDKPSVSLYAFPRKTRRKGEMGVLPNHITHCEITIRLKIMLIF